MAVAFEPRAASRVATPVPAATERVLVTDGEQRSALALVRAFGEAGHRVVVTSGSGRSLAGASRRAAVEHRVPDALRDPRAFATAVLELVRRERATAVVPVSEQSLLALLPARARLEEAGALLPFADLDVFRRVSDKALVTATAPSCGIAVPAQHLARTRAEAMALADGELPFPVVLKPVRSVADGDAVRLTVKHAADRAEMRARLAALPDAAFPLLVQQRIVGPGVGIFLLLWEGETVAAFSHRRLLEKPPSGGVSVYRESIAAEPGLVEKSRRLLEAFDWRGVAMVEYKIDAATGTPYLMEINGRFWGSLQLALDAGVDFPALLLAAAAGLRPAPVRDYRVGVRSRWWWGQVDHLLARLRHGDAALATPPGTPPVWRVALDLVLPFRAGDRSEILRVHDPMPALRETLGWLRRR